MESFLNFVNLIGLDPRSLEQGFNWSHWGFILKHFSSGLREIPQVSEVIYGPPFECGLFWKEHMRVITIKTPFKEAFLCKTQ